MREIKMHGLGMQVTKTEKQMFLTYNTYIFL